MEGSVDIVNEERTYETMAESTKEQLITAAAHLLDGGGQAAVTLRAVAELVNVSHNAPYRHFRDRSALLAAVAERDFRYLRRKFDEQLDRYERAEFALQQSIALFVDYGLSHNARYRLLFSDPDLQPEEGLKQAALSSFQSFHLIVSKCQHEGVLPSADSVGLTGLIYAALHGAIDLDIGGRASDAKGLSSVDATVSLLFSLLGKVRA
jgi:AcrR family transcriptional regulator